MGARLCTNNRGQFAKASTGVAANPRRKLPTPQHMDIEPWRPHPAKDLVEVSWPFFSGVRADFAALAAVVRAHEGGKACVEGAGLGVNRIWNLEADFFRDS
jgi:hypothetical protein